MAARGDSVSFEGGDASYETRGFDVVVSAKGHPPSPRPTPGARSVTRHAKNWHMPKPTGRNDASGRGLWNVKSQSFAAGGWSLIVWGSPYTLTSITYGTFSSSSFVIPFLKSVGLITMGIG